MLTIIKLTYDQGVIATYLDTEDHIVMDQIQAEVLGSAQAWSQVQDMIATDAGCTIEDLALQDGYLDGGRKITHFHSLGEGGTMKWEIDDDGFRTVYLINL